MAPRRRKQTNPMSQGTGKGGGSSVNPMSKGTGTTTAPQSAGSRRRTQAGPPIKRRTTTTTTPTRSQGRGGRYGTEGGGTGTPPGGGYGGSTKASPRNRTPAPVGSKAPEVPKRRATKGTATPRQGAPEGSAGTNKSRIKRAARPRWTTPGLIDNPEAYKKRFPKAKLRRVKGGAVLVGRGMAGTRKRKTKTTSAGPLTKK